MWTGVLFGVNALLNLGLMLGLARVMTPDNYGALAVWSAAAAFLVTSLFDWARFSAMRFYTARVRAEEPAVRATLDIGMAGSAPLLVLVVAALAWTGALPRLTSLGALSLAVLAMGNAASEYLGAIARSVASWRLYARLIAVRHALAFGAAIPVAAITNDLTLTIAALAVAIWPGVIVGFLALRDPGAGPRLARASLARSYLSYGVPVIAAEATFQGAGLLNRAWLGSSAGLAAAGAYSLAFELAFKVMAVTASMAEAYLLPRLVALRERSAEEGEAALTRTIGLVLMLVAPAGVSFWTLCEPFAALAISPGLSGQFVAISALATACAALYTFQAYVLRPAFQMGLSTMPLLQSAALALAVNFAVLWSLAGTPENVATAHLAGLAAGCVWLLGRALIGLRVRWPVADTLKIAAAALLMGWAGRTVASMVEGPTTALLLGSAAMATVYGLALLALDAAGLRRLALARLKR